MKTRQYSLKPLVYSSIPIGAIGLVMLAIHTFPANWGCFGFPNSFADCMKAVLPCCVIPLVLLMAIPFGIYGIKSGMVEIQAPGLKPKALMTIAIILGVLDLVAGAGFLYYLSLRW